MRTSMFALGSFFRHQGLAMEEMTVRSPHVVRIDPDVFLQTPAGRVWTPERSQEAWRRAYEALRDALAAEAVERRRVVIVCGLQGAGKSSWIERHASRYAPGIFFDAALPGARHRAQIVEIARQCDAKLWAVWINTPLDVALRRNAQRPVDERVPEDAIHSVAALFEPPTLSEGFEDIIVVDSE